MKPRSNKSGKTLKKKHQTQHKKKNEIKTKTRKYTGGARKVPQRKPYADANRGFHAPGRQPAGHPYKSAASVASAASEENVPHPVIDGHVLPGNRNFNVNQTGNGESELGNATSTNVTNLNPTLPPNDSWSKTLSFALGIGVITGSVILATSH